jgi:hypothetical protein
MPLIPNYGSSKNLSDNDLSLTDKTSILIDTPKVLTDNHQRLSDNSTFITFHPLFTQPKQF